MNDIQPLIERLERRAMRTAERIVTTSSGCESVDPSALEIAYRLFAVADAVRDRIAREVLSDGR